MTSDEQLNSKFIYRKTERVKTIQREAYTSKGAKTELMGSNLKPV